MSPNLKTETRQVSGFDRVVLTDFGELTIQQGEVESLTIEASPELLEKIRSDVEGNTLTIGFRSWLDRILSPFEHHVRYTLQLKNLSALKITGAVQTRAGSLRAGELVIEVSGSSDLRIDQLTAEALNVTISGSGDFHIAGKVQSQALRISGSARIEAPDLESQRTTIHISGSGHATLWVNESLDVRVSGAGTVEYKGAPSVNQTISGVGKVRQLQA